MAAPQRVLKSIDARLSRIERRSLRSVQVASVLDSIRQVASLAVDLIGKAGCLSESTGCREYNGGRLCSTGCGRVLLVERGGETIVYKYGGNSISIRASAGELLISTKEVSIGVKLGEVTLKLPRPEGEYTVSVKLDDEEELLRRGHLVKLGTRKLSTHLSRLLNALTHCIQSKRLQC